MRSENQADNIVLYFQGATIKTDEETGKIIIAR